MSKTINFAIDLGTTNSLIARYEGGKVEVFKSPVSWKNTLPSVVAFRNERIIVGEKAKELVGKDPSNVFAHFKRKMGTADTYHVPNLKTEKTPIELSACVLKELKTFLVNGEQPESVVITIPASFDTIQSNATKKAGYEAGFKEVALLQEPVAASLAFANIVEEEELTGQWLVYDLGGGTFDAALVRLDDGDMRVVDHEGDNYLGGLDFDTLILDEIVLPYLQSKGSFTNLAQDLKNKGGRLEKTYFELLYKAEQAKIQVSASEETEIECEIEDEDGWEREYIIPVRRSDFERIIAPKIEGTIQLLRELVQRNNLSVGDVRQVVLVGGSTYIPYVRKRISEVLDVPVNIKTDPTVAVAVGAAYYAGTKTAQLVPEANTATQTEQGQPLIFVKTAYQKVSQAAQEYFTAAISGAWQGTQYRITRDDGGYDSGLKNTEERFSEMLPLVRDAFNTFTLRFFDKYQTAIPSDAVAIGVMHGKFNLQGQPLPNDICIEVDDIENETTRLEPIFDKNAILPLRKTIIKSISKTIEKGGNERLIINVLEGKRGATPASCLPLGVIEIKGSDLPFSLVKGSDVEITLELSESRDLTVNAYLSMTGQEFKNVFNPSERHILLAKLRDEVRDLLSAARREMSVLERNENFETAARVKKIEEELALVLAQLMRMKEGDMGDQKYQIEEQKRRLSQSLDITLYSTRNESIKSLYFEARNEAHFFLQKAPNAELQKRYDHMIADEKAFLAGDDISIIKSKTSELETLAWQIKQRDPHFLTSAFHYYAMLPDNEYNEPNKAHQFKEMGERALGRQNYDELLTIIYNLYHIYPKEKLGGHSGFVGLG
jgi:molecular chaperone DnaK